MKTEVDLLWHGGIGTYVKRKAESHLDAGDKATDAISVNGVDLRLTVVGEGGNLRLTQLARAMMGAVEISNRTGESIIRVADVYFALGERL